jgi:hypothetical protein
MNKKIIVQKINQIKGGILIYLCLFVILTCAYGCVSTVYLSLEREQLTKQPEFKINRITLHNGKIHTFNDAGGCLMSKKKDSMEYLAVIGIDSLGNSIDEKIENVYMVEVEKNQINIHRTIIFSVFFLLLMGLIVAGSALG